MSAPFTVRVSWEDVSTHHGRANSGFPIPQYPFLHHCLWRSLDHGLKEQRSSRKGVLGPILLTAGLARSQSSDVNALSSEPQVRSQDWMYWTFAKKVSLWVNGIWTIASRCSHICQKKSGTNSALLQAGQGSILCTPNLSLASQGNFGAALPYISKPTLTYIPFAFYLIPSTLARQGKPHFAILWCNKKCRLSILRPSWWAWLQTACSLQELVDVVRR